MKETGVEQKFLDLFLNEKYLTKDEIKYRLPSEIRLDAFWDKLAELRRQKSRNVPLVDQKGELLWYNLTPATLSKVEELNHIASKNLEKIVHRHIRKDIIFEAMLEEAFSSSVIEGAITTRKRTKELVEKKESPKNKSEQMVLNNYHVMKYIFENLQNEITHDVIVQMQKIVTKNTLDKEDESEAYRTDSTQVVSEMSGETIYAPPSHTVVQELMDDLIGFINDKSEAQFVPPILKAQIIHFYFVYVHPFFDGNGRTARALSYMYLLQQGYDFFRLFSISTVIAERRGRYYEAIKAVEDHQSDVTYFLDSMLEMTLQSVYETIDKIKKSYDYNILLEHLKQLELQLNERQLKFLRYMTKKDSNIVLIEDYQKRYGVSYETARRDLKELTALGIVKEMTQRKKYVYKFLGATGLGTIDEDAEFLL